MAEQDSNQPEKPEVEEESSSESQEVPIPEQLIADSPQDVQESVQEFMAEAAAAE